MAVMGTNDTFFGMTMESADGTMHVWCLLPLFTLATGHSLNASSAVVWSKHGPQCTLYARRLGHGRIKMATRARVKR